MQLPLSSNTYDDVTDFRICGFHKNTKIVISRERNIFFFKQKNSLIAHQRPLYDKEQFYSGGNL